MPPRRRSPSRRQSQLRRDRHHRYSANRPHRHQLGVADRRHQLAGADHPADREPARHGQEHRSVLLRRRRTRFRTPRASCARHRCADLPGDEVLVQINGKRFNRSALVQVYTGGDTGLSFGSQGADISRDPRDRHQEPAGAARRRDRAIWLGRHRRRDELRHAQRPRRPRTRGALRPDITTTADTRLDSGKSRQIAGTAGIGIGATGFIDVAGEYYNDDGTSRGATRPIAVIFAQQQSEPRQPAAQLSAAGADLGHCRRSMAGRAWSTPAST